jgi:hypothetical protein
MVPLWLTPDIVLTATIMATHLTIITDIDRMAGITAIGPTEIMVGAVIMVEVLVVEDTKDGVDMVGTVEVLAVVDMVVTDVDIFAKVFV